VLVRRQHDRRDSVDRRRRHGRAGAAPEPGGGGQHHNGNGNNNGDAGIQRVLKATRRARGDGGRHGGLRVDALRGIADPLCVGLSERVEDVRHGGRQ
jgi:hypothetical protein